MKSLTLFICGYDKCVINLIPDVFLGTRPIGEHLRFEIGRLSKGPAILPAKISVSTFCLAATGLINTDFRFFDSNDILEPW